MRVLLVRLDGVGDALACTPLVAALRDAGHTLGIALSTRNADAFAPGVFVRTHVLERIPWPAHGTTPETWGPAVADARAAAYDVALVVSEEPDAYRFARVAGIARRIGFTNGWERPLKTLGTILGGTRAVVRAAKLGGDREHECAIVYRLGAELVRESTPPRDIARLRPLVLGARCAGAAIDRDATLVQLTTKWRASGVDDVRLVAILRAVGQTRDTHAIAAADEAAAMRPLAESAGVPLTVFDAIRPWAWAIANARALVTPDTGAAHVAGCVGTPTVVVWPNAPRIDARIARWKPWAAPSAQVIARAGNEVATDVLRELGRLVTTP